MSNALVHAVESRTPRNSKRRITFAAGGALLAAAAAAAVPFQAASAAPADVTSCLIQELPTPEDKYFSLVTGMSNDGSVIAYRVYPAGLEGEERYLYVYEDGEAVEVPMPGVDQNLTDINSDGLGVGVSFVDGVQLPFVYRDGEVAELAVNDGGAATGVNEEGDIVGFSGQGPIVPVLWRDGEVKPVELPMPEGAPQGQATSIDDDGTIVGSIQDPTTGMAVPYMWRPDGTGEALALPEGFDPATTSSSASEVSGDWVVGNALNADTETGVRWNLEEGTVETLDMLYSAAVNEEGTAAGQTEPNASYQEAGYQGKAVALPALVDPSDNWFGDIATAISSDGSQLAGQVYAGQDATDTHLLKAVVWYCD